jgi:hypothetical protein
MHNMRPALFIVECLCILKRSFRLPCIDGTTTNDSTAVSDNDAVNEVHEL